MNEPSQVTAVPGHVAAERVFDYDYIHDERFRHSEPHDVAAELALATPGVFWTPRNGGHWVICQRDVLEAAATDAALFSSHSVSLPATEYEPDLIPLKHGGEIHLAYRQPLTRAFLAKSVKALEAKIVGLANNLIDEVIDDGRCDFIETVAEVLPVVVFMELMGIPTERLREFREWVSLSSTSTDPAEREMNFGRIISTMDEIIRQRQNRREDDLISKLLDSEIRGRPVTFEEMRGYCTMLFLAGLDTVSNSMAFGICHLARDPGLRAYLAANPQAIPDANEEILRRYSVANVTRVVTRDAQFAGVQMKAEDRVLLVLPAGNLDARAVPNPTEIHLGDSNKRHIAFNVGPHTCVGRSLARAELNILYREWLRRIPSFAMDPSRPVVFRTGFTMAVDHLPLVW